MYFIEQEHQKCKQIEEELFTLNSKTPCLSEYTEVIIKISVKLPSKKFIHKITTSFDKILKQLSMGIIVKVETFEPGTSF